MMVRVEQCREGKPHAQSETMQLKGDILNETMEPWEPWNHMGPKGAKQLACMESCGTSFQYVSVSHIAPG